MFVLGNHGLVIGGEDARAVEDLLTEVKATRGHSSPKGTSGRLCGACGNLQGFTLGLAG